jgi:hypothetical protein
MDQASARRSIIACAAIAAAMLVMSCGDKGAKQGDTTAAHGAQAAPSDVAANVSPDSVPNVYSRQRYLLRGTPYEVLYVGTTNEKAPPGAKPGPDTMSYARFTPLVFRDKKLAGRGWAYWDSLAKANNIPLKKH